MNCARTRTRSTPLYIRYSISPFIRVQWSGTRACACATWPRLAGSGACGRKGENLYKSARGVVASRQILDADRCSAPTLVLGYRLFSFR